MWIMTLMKHILTLKAQQCTDDKPALLNSAPVMAATITHIFKGAGISTQPQHTLNQNIGLASIMADIRDELVAQHKKYTIIIVILHKFKLSALSDGLFLYPISLMCSYFPISSKCTLSFLSARH